MSANLYGASSSSSSTHRKNMPELKNVELMNRVDKFVEDIRDSKSTTKPAVQQNVNNPVQNVQSDERFFRKKEVIRDLQHFLTKELTELKEEQKKLFYDSIIERVGQLLSGTSSSSNSMSNFKIGFLLMCILLDLPTGKYKPMVSIQLRIRYMWNNLDQWDEELLELVACTLGKMVTYSDPRSQSDLVNHIFSESIEYLAQKGDSRLDIGKKHSALLNLREVAILSPLCFFTQIENFFDSPLFDAINEPKLRAPAILCLRSGFQVLIDREYSLSLSSKGKLHTSNMSQVDQQIPKCYNGCYEEIIKCLDPKGDLNMSGVGKQRERDERVHAALSILNELLHCSFDTSLFLQDSFSLDLEDLYHKLQDFSNITFTNADSTSAPNVVSDNSEQQVTPNYLTKLFRNYSLSNNIPIHSGSRDIYSVVNYHKDLGLALIPYAQKPKKMNLSNCCREFLIRNYESICKSVTKLFKQKNSIQINQVLLLILPSLVSINPDQFVKQQKYVEETVLFYLNCIKISILKPLAFMSIGLFALGLQHHYEKIEEFVPTILALFHSAFPQLKESGHSAKKRTLPQPDPTVYTCLVLICRAWNCKIQSEIEKMLPAMFHLGLSEPFANSLFDICKYMPDMKRNIHEGLLKMLAQIIMNRTFKFPKILNNNPLLSQISYTPTENFEFETLKLAIKVLGRFDFQPQYTIRFLPYCADNYLVHENNEIRFETVYTCCHLLKTEEFLRPKNSFEQTTIDVLSKLIVVGIRDKDKFVRYLVFSRMDERLDYYLVMKRNLEMIQKSLNDEVFEIRELGICLLGRLCNLNPAHIMPFLRITCTQLLTELENSGIPKNMEQSARLMGHLLASTPRLVRPFTEPIMKIFLPKVTDSSSTVSTAVISAIGEQAIVSGLEMRAWFYKLFPLLLNSIQEMSTLQKREISLWTMGKLVENCGFVIEPYWKFPQLMDILFDILKSDSSSSELMRRETIRVLGLLGAIDPYRHKVGLGVIELSGQSIVHSPPVEEADTMQEMLANYMTNTLEDYYSTQAIHTLIKVMQDPSASALYETAAHAIRLIFEVLNFRSVTYISYILPPFSNIIRTEDIKIKEFMLRNLGDIIMSVKKHIRVYLDDIFKLLEEHWDTDNDTLQMALFYVVECIVRSLGGEFRTYVPHLIPHILKVLNQESIKGQLLEEILKSLQTFGTNLEDYIFLLIPPILARLDTSNTILVRIEALKTIDSFFNDLMLTNFSTRIVHAIERLLDSSEDEDRLVQPAMNTLCKLVLQMGDEYSIYVQLIDKVMQKHKIRHAQYEELVKKIEKGQDLDQVSADNLYTLNSRRLNNRKVLDNRGKENLIQPFKPGGVNLRDVKHSWQKHPRRVSKEDWMNWLNDFILDLIKSSPNFCIRTCFQVATKNNLLAVRDLFNPAFLSCWIQLSARDQTDLIDSLHSVLKEQEIPEVTGILLNLAEFLEHMDQGPFPFDVKILGERAMKCKAYAKALHYKEKEFTENPSNEVLGALITINNKLQQRYASLGVLCYASKNFTRNEMHLKEKWYEKLGYWQAAFVAHTIRGDNKAKEKEALLGQMRCLDALSEFEVLHNLVLSSETTFIQEDTKQATDFKQRMSRLAVGAAWNLNKWEDLDRFVDYVPTESSDSAFYKAVIQVHNGLYGEAQAWIDCARKLIDPEITNLVGESYNRAYPTMVNIQLLSELEEVIQYKLVPERREMIKQKWWQRLLGCQGLIDDWRKVLQVHSLVLDKRDDIKAWLKYAKLCERNHRMDLSFQTLISLMEAPHADLLDPRIKLPMKYPEVTFKFINHLWAVGHFKRAYIELFRFQEALENPVHLSGAIFGYYSSGTILTNAPQEYDYTTQMMSDPFNQNANSFHLMPKNSSAAISKLLSKTYHKLAECQEYLVGFSERTILPILEKYKKAVSKDHQWYKAWHSWAFMNFRALKFLKERYPQLQENLEAPIPKNIGLNPKEFCIQALVGFFKSVSLSHHSGLQDTLRILTLWFEDGYNIDVRMHLDKGIKTVSIETWLKVIPQIIARIDGRHEEVVKLVHQLLVNIGKEHPQALLFPLRVASETRNNARSDAALKILDQIKVHSGNLVNEAILVSEELVRIAILWHELWYEGIEEASKFYFGEKKMDAMLDTLEPLHRIIEQAPLTNIEHTFLQQYQKDLSSAHDLLKEYRATKNPAKLQQAWDFYYQIFKRIGRQLPTLTSLELQQGSPKLTECKNLELAVPGSYRPNQEIIRIAKIESQITIITSKQRPRKLTIKGSNGLNYVFLLKGHEDLRQDERVMQLFSLVNNLMNADNSTTKQNLAIQRYAVVPLQPNNGLIGWVPHSDTMHALIRDYRDKKKILLNMEHRLMLRMHDDYERLDLNKKVQVFEHALEHTPGDDLAKILWIKSPSAEVWFERRTNYTRSLAVMSMVGYILGLGDRHPSNLMIDRMSGKILHIDFGDCFEVAMMREKYPEKIPFRLTRMLIKAMEVTGLDGTFMRTSEIVMMLMRKHKESLIALLEAFVYDPLVNWRLNEAAQQKIRQQVPPVQVPEEFSNDLNAGDMERIARSLRSAMLKDKASEPKLDFLNQKAVQVISRIRDKLSGTDFDSGTTTNRRPLDVPTQVNLLVEQATSHLNLCQCYIGWCPFW